SDEAQPGKRVDPHSLNLRSYPEKLQKVESTRREALDSIGNAWVVLVLTALVGGLVWTFVYSWRLGGCLAIIVIVVVTIDMLLPAIRSDRVHTRRTVLRYVE